MNTARVVVLGLIALLVTAPLALRDRPVVPPAGQRRLVIVTPHGEAIRSEFTTAFSAWMRREQHLEVDLDWRTPGGTSDIVRYLDERFKAAFSEAFPVHRAALKEFNDPKAATPARQAFLGSSIGIGFDVFFGGGEFTYRGQADKGYLVDCGILASDPSWFAGPQPLIPQILSGETVYDPKGRYIAACFGAFGIASSVERLAAAALPFPTQWEDIAGPAYRRGLTLTDPTKSGAAATAFERILQQALAAAGDDREAGWVAGFGRIKRLVGNSRWVTDSASKPVRDTARGDCLAGMAIDFQAKIEAEFASAAAGGGERLRFVIPIGGTSVSGDPIAVFRGAPEPELARTFIRFVMSVEGQRLWNQQVGTPGGPQRTALRRFPVRRDLLGLDQAALRSDPSEDPYAIAQQFTYHPEWTGKSFTLIQALIKAIALDSREELIPAWDAICAAGGPERVPEAWEQFTWMPVTLVGAPALQAEYRASPQAAITLQRQWIEQASLHYRLARSYAEAGR